MTGPDHAAAADALRREFRAIAGLLEGSPAPAVREDAKRRIIALFRRVDSALADLGQLKEEIRGLVDLYKQLAAEDPSSQAPALAGQRPQLRERHQRQLQR